MTADANDSIVTDPTGLPHWRGRRCRCGICGKVERCTPRSDFYHLERLGEKFLRCEECVGKGIPGRLVIERTGGPQ